MIPSEPAARSTSLFSPRTGFFLEKSTLETVDEPTILELSNVDCPRKTK